uniref:Uncharacterized protein n=1 Tax=feces metagenome TaxID=1861841 RepID=A0A7M2QNS7_9ZZZZ
MLPKINRDASKEEQIAQAAAYAGVSPKVLDGMWRTETGRGTHPTMVGPQTKWGQAKGHFQQLDSIQKEFSRRAGTEFDPFDFTDSLTMAAMQMKENMGRYGNEADAVLAYHGGTNKANWGAKTRDYLRKVMGADVVEGKDAGRTALGPAPSGQGILGAAPTLDEVRVTGKGGKENLTEEETWFGANGGNGADGEKLGADFSELISTPQTNIYQDWANAESKRDFDKQTVINERPFWGTSQDSVVGASIQKNLNPIWNVMQRMTADPEDYKSDPIFRAAINMDWQHTVEGFDQPYEHQYLLNSVSPADLERRKHYLREQRVNNKVIEEAGPWQGLAAGFVAGAVDPMTYVTGLGAMKVMAMTGKGAYALASGGRVAAATGSAVVENVMGNIAYDALQQAMGEHKTADDYALSALTGLIPAAIAIPGLRGHAFEEAKRRLQEQANMNLAKQAAEWEQVAKDLGPDATPDEIKAEYDRRAMANLDQAKNDLTTGKSYDNDVVIKDPSEELEKELADAADDVDTDVRPTDSDPVTPTREEAETEWVEPKLPSSLAKADPRYGSNQLEFESDLDKAAYITANKANKSASDAEFVKWAKDEFGVDEADLRAHGNVVKRAIKTAQPEGGVIKVGKVEGKVALGWRDGTIRSKHVLGTFLDNVVAKDPDSLLAKAAKLLKDAPGVADAATKLSGNARSNVKHQGIVTFGKGTQNDPFIVVHEAVHVATLNRIETYLRAPQALGARDKTNLKNLDKLYQHLGKRYEQLTGNKMGQDSPDHVTYAFKNLHEFAAQALSSREFQLWLTTQPAPGFVKATPKRNAWRSFLTSIKDVLGIKHDKSALDEVIAAMDEVISVKDSTLLDKAGNAVAWAKKKAKPKLGTDPISMKYGLNRLPDDSPLERANKKAIIKLYHDATEWAKKNPRNEDAIKTLMDNKYLNMATPGTLIAKEDNVVARWVSAKLLEQTMGAHGRKANAAIAKAVKMQSYIGSFVDDFDTNYTAWRNARAGNALNGTKDDIVNQSLQREFNRAVFMEVEARGLTPERLTTDPHVKAAADSYEKHMEFMRQEQVRTKTPGFAGLPESSRGYATHLIDAEKIKAMGNDGLNAMHQALKDQFQHGLEDMDEAFADKVAGIYLRNALDRANGISNIPAEVRNMHASEFIRDALEKADLTPEEVAKLTSRLSYGAASHTKARLKIDTLKEYTRADGSKFQLADLYRHDMRDILRGYASRVSGEVALMEHGVAGSAGMHLIRQALAADPNFKAHDAIDQVTSELLGRPVNGQAENMFLNGVMEYTSLTNMGWMGFMQVGEYIHSAVTLGLGNTLGAMGAIPRLRAEIHAILRGETVENGILRSIELRGGGGEFGVDGYRMISGYDTTARHEEYTSTGSSGPITRLLHKAGYGLGVVTLNRVVHAVQKRGIAEQIVLRALRELKDGNLSVILKDMGFDDDLAKKIGDDLAEATVWKNGKVQSFDITKFKSQDAQEAFLQAVHRGVNQTIQGTFIGERGWWTHTNLGRFATQFRNFPITAMEKQWGRLTAAHGGGVGGMMAATGMIVAAAGLAIPMYAARVAVNAAGREDADEYIDNALTPTEIAKNVMNYIAITGMMQDFLQLITTTAGAINDDFKVWVPEQGRGGAPNRTTISGLIPGVSSMDKVLALPGQLQDPHKLVRALPYTNLPWLTPMVNALRD